MRAKTASKDPTKTMRKVVKKAGSFKVKQPEGVMSVKEPEALYAPRPAKARRIRGARLLSVRGLVDLPIDPQEDEAALAAKLVTELADDSADVNVLCETYDLKREELGRLTGFSLRALAEWASGRLPSQPAKRRLHEVRRLLDALSEIVKRESLKKWLHQPNPAFDRLTPLQVIEVGEMDRLWAMVYQLGAGQPG